MAELADAADSKSADPCDRGGSTPPPGTTFAYFSCRNEVTHALDLLQLVYQDPAVLRQ